VSDLIRGGGRRKKYDFDRAGKIKGVTRGSQGATRRYHIINYQHPARLT
jgi:hypothetical protein